jgi:RNA polymerase sigma-70 factor (ECF subfamily)
VAVNNEIRDADSRAAIRRLSGLVADIAKRQDRAAFGVLFTHFAPRVKAYLMRAGVAPTAAEDLAQETMLTVWRKAALFDPAKAGISTWIFTIARNLRIDALRRERHPEVPHDDAADVPDPAPQADDALLLTQNQARIRAAVEALPQEQAEVVRLSFFADKPHREIERELGIPLGTVKSRLRLAMRHIRSFLGEEP